MPCCSQCRMFRRSEEEKKEDAGFGYCTAIEGRKRVEANKSAASCPFDEFAPK